VLTSLPGSRGSSVDIVTDYGLDSWGLISGRGKRLFSSPQRPELLSGPTSLLSNGYQGLFSPGVKRSGREGDHSPLCNVEVKNDGAVLLLSLSSSRLSA
jgi:hypothetical protein